MLLLPTGKEIFFLAFLLVLPQFLWAADWTRIAEDGIHDPSNIATSSLQEPSDALAGFPESNIGNKVDWVKALDSGLIQPRYFLESGALFEVVSPGKLRTDEEAFRSNRLFRAVDFDIIFKNTGSMPFVKFPHLPHTKWLTCANCHPKIFLPQRGSNPVSMQAIVNGQFCGVCHGKVAFPPLDCAKCHSIARQE